MVTGLLNAIVVERGIGVTRDVAYGPHGRHRLDVYRPPAGQELRAVVVFLYGGGWTSGDRATYRFVASALAARGHTTVVPDYRLHPEVRFPDFLHDVGLAYRWVAAQFQDRCGRARPLVVMGHSAGAYNAAMLALDPSLHRDGARQAVAPTALVGLAGPSAFDPTTWPSTREIFATAAGAPDRARPIAFVRAAAPPSLLLHGGGDDTVELYNTRDLGDALRRHGNVATEKIYDGIGHVGLVLAIARPLRWRAPVLDDVLSFIARHAGAPEAACGG